MRRRESARGKETRPSEGLTLERTSEMLRACGIEPTHQRMLIARALFDRPEHASADQILSRVNASRVEASKATIYNALRLFVQQGLIRELVVHPGKIVYDPNTIPHHHLYDVESGKLTDVPADGVQVVGLPPLPAGTVAESVDIIVRTRRAS